MKNGRKRKSSGKSIRKNPSAELRGEKLLSSMLRLYGLWQGGLACISDITWSMKIWLAMVYLD